MSCSNCGNQPKAMGYYKPLSLETPPFNSTDSMILDKDGEIRKLTSDDWKQDRHKLILFFPETNTPICNSELGELKKWVEEFNKINVEVYGATTDPVYSIKDWYDNEESLANANFITISSYLLPSRLNILNNGRTKRASVFMSISGEVIIQEHPMKVGRSMSELNRWIYGYTTNSYCATGWTNPEDSLKEYKGKEL